jgi:hypothetical protein
MAPSSDIENKGDKDRLVFICSSPQDSEAITRSCYDIVACGQRRLGDIPPKSASAARKQPSSLRHF